MSDKTKKAVLNSEELQGGEDTQTTTGVVPLDDSEAENISGGRSERWPVDPEGTPM